MTTRVFASASQILYVIAPGKPDPKAPCTKETVISRPRVEQSSQKGPTCWYYSLNMIRVRVGKNPSEDFKEEREIEKIISQRRKLVTAIREKQDHDKAIVQQLITDPNYVSRRLWTKEGALKLLPRFIELSKNSDPTVKEEGLKLVRILQGFTKQDRFDHLQEHTDSFYCEQLNKTNVMFLKRLGKNPEAYFEADRVADRASGMPLSFEGQWEDLSEAMKRNLLENYFFRASFERYRLQVSSWHPEHGSARLVEVLRENGPMYITGLLGRSYYKADPKVVDQIASREILGWPKGSDQKDLQIFHSVVVVGGNSEGRGFVYFVDPLDKSGPLKERPIYVSSYEGFIRKLGDLRNRFFESGGFSYDIGYGLHSSKLN